MKRTVAVLAIITVMALLLVGCGGNNASTSGVTVNNAPVATQDSAKKASTNVTMELTGSENVMVVDLTVSGANSAKINLSGKNSGKTFSASSDDVVGDIFNSIKDLVGNSGIVHGEGTAFYINSNAFEDGEVVVVEIVFNSSENAWDKAFGKGTESEYWAFTACHSEDAPAETETSDDGNNATEGTDAGDTDDDSQTEETTPSTEEGIIDKIIDGLQGFTGDSSINENGELEVSKEPAGAFTIGGYKLNTYDTQEAAQANIQGLPSKLAESPEMVGYPLENTARIKVWFEGQADNRELLLWPENNWTGSFSMAEYSGQIVTLCIAYESAGIIPDFTFEYVTVQVP